MIALRQYQQASIAAVIDYWKTGGGNPLVDMATGLGKSVVIAKLTRDLLTTYPDMRVLMLVHVRELVQQNAMAMLNIWPDAPLGIYSAGLNRRDAHHRITFASIQSVFRKGAQIGPRDLVLIDEAHLVPSGGDGMYRTLIEKLREQRADMRVAGFTATPFRLDTGRLDVGGERLFDEIVYSYGIRAGIDDGWLAPLISKATMQGFNVAGVAKRGGEFIPGALEAAVDRDPITRAAVAELAGLGADRRSWLVFCAGVKHAHHVGEAIRASGVSCETITGETLGNERARHIADFKAGRLRALTNANVLTTGFDAPGVDLIAMLRPTLSTGLFVQMCGRGTRLADGKANCLVLDFAGNVRRHGPVDTVEVEGRSRRPAKDAGAVKEETVRAKECPTCHAYAPLNAGVCRWCGHEWPVETKPKHERTADAETPILSTEAQRLSNVDEQPVVAWQANIHRKEGAPDSLRITYQAGLLTYPEWICLEHHGRAGERAKTWWLAHGGLSPVPTTIAEAKQRFKELSRPSVIFTRKNGRWFDVIGRSFDRERERAA